MIARAREWSKAGAHSSSAVAICLVDMLSKRCEFIVGPRIEDPFVSRLHIDFDHRWLFVRLDA